MQECFYGSDFMPGPFFDFYILAPKLLPILDQGNLLKGSL